MRLLLMMTKIMICNVSPCRCNAVDGERTWTETHSNHQTSLGMNLKHGHFYVPGRNPRTRRRAPLLSELSVSHSTLSHWRDLTNLKNKSAIKDYTKGFGWSHDLRISSCKDGMRPVFILFVCSYFYRFMVWCLCWLHVDRNPCSTVLNTLPYIL